MQQYGQYLMTELTRPWAFIECNYIFCVCIILSTNYSTEVPHFQFISLYSYVILNYIKVYAV